jgi:lipid II:glycine glycyltransferase (peptidoglycan interpeptide bridge formation enzyme)
VRARPATDDETRSWDQLLVETGRPHLLQSTGWATLKSATGWLAERYVLEDDGGRCGLAQVLRKRVGPSLSITYAPRGPLCADAALPEAIDVLRRSLGRGFVISLLCDPEVPASDDLLAELARRGVMRSSVYVQPRRTLLIDLRQDPEAMLAAMRKKTRQYIRKAEREAVATEETTDLARFHRLLRGVAERDAFGIHDLAYFAALVDAFGDRLHILMARIGAEDVGALLVIRMGDRAWELFGGWSGTHTEQRPFYLLKWRSLMRMQQLGVRRYDMWGLAEGNELAGVENFKLGFGGEVATWIGALEMPVTAPLFPLWRFGARRRLAAAGI